jgi:hypothetical protein
MSRKIALSTYVEDIMDIFEIPNKHSNFARIRKKFQRELDKMGVWEKAETKRIGRSKTKLFSENDLFLARLSITDYLLKNGNIDEERYKAYKDDFHNPDNFSTVRMQEKEEEKEFLRTCGIHEVTHQEKINLMIEAIYKVFYEDINIELWNSDKATGSLANFDDPTSIEGFKIMERLNNPVESYCKRKKED